MSISWLGGPAVALHGHPRTTGHLDIWIATSAGNLDSVRRTLVAFGFPEDQVTSLPPDKPEKIVRMGRPPLRIELLTGISGVTFESCYARRETQPVDGIPITFISRPDLLPNKRAAGRTQDLADLEELS